MKCRVCGNDSGNTSFRLREMMFGYRDEFEYFECSRCGCVQIVDVPDSMAKYYPDNYHSFVPISRSNRLRRLLIAMRDRSAVTGRGLIGKLLSRSHPPNTALPSLAWLQPDRSARILDVGCGSGLMLNALGGLRFQSLLGVDPFLPGDVEYANGVKLLKATIHELSGEFDIITLHHSFEHLSDPEPTLEAVKARLAPVGHCIIRLPVSSSFAWKHYGPNWVQLDPPRHFYIHSVRSMGILAERAGFEIARVAYDSTAFQFWASEQYRRDIPLFDRRSYAVSPGASIFTQAEILAFEKRARELNDAGLGDQAVFYLKKASVA